jgi:hypothetical protein
MVKCCELHIAVNYWAYCRKEKKHLQPLISATRNLRYVLQEKENGREVWDMSFLFFPSFRVGCFTCREDTAPNTFLDHPILTNRFIPIPTPSPSISIYR